VEINNNLTNNWWYIELLEGDESKWEKVLEYAIPKATHFAFNILYSNMELNDFLIKYRDSIIEITKNKEKVYKSGRVLKMRKTDLSIELLNNMLFFGFKNYFIEDPSFYIDDKEFIASITHEDQILLNEELVDLTFFKKFDLENKFKKEIEVGFWRRIKNIFS
jgi:hypothetical protein